VADPDGGLRLAAPLEVLLDELPEPVAGVVVRVFSGEADVDVVARAELVADAAAEVRAGSVVVLTAAETRAVVVVGAVRASAVAPATRWPGNPNARAPSQTTATVAAAATISQPEFLLVALRPRRALPRVPVAIVRSCRQRRRALSRTPAPRTLPRGDRLPILSHSTEERRQR
jgi:hypothetical protein